MYRLAGAKRREWGNDPIHNYVHNPPSNPHSLLKKHQKVDSYISLSKLQCYSDLTVTEP